MKEEVEGGGVGYGDDNFFIFMEMHQIRYFLAVARVGSFSGAARECHVSQPSLSQQIMKLEDELGERLFFRQAQGAELTPAGLLFEPYASRIMQEVEEAQRRVSESNDTVRGRLVLGVLPTIAPYMLPALLGPFTQRYPEVEVVVQEEITPRVLEAVHRGDMDLALLSLPVAAGALESLELFEERLLLVLPERHRLAQDTQTGPDGQEEDGESAVSMRELTNEKFILMQEGHCLADQALEFCHTRGDFQPSVSCRSAQVQTLLALVGAGLGLSMVPEMAVQPERGVVYRMLAPKEPTRKIGFVWRKNRFRSLSAQRFVEWTQAMCEKRARYLQGGMAQ